MPTDDGFETHHSEYLEKQKDIVRDELRDEHAQQLLDWVYDRNVLTDESSAEYLADSTARNYLRELRFVISYAYDFDWISDDPTEWTAKDWNKLIKRVARKREIGDGTKRNTCYGARAFVKWLDETAVDDHEEIDAPTVKHEKIDVEKVLEPHEVVEIIEATRTERDAALLAVMYEAALRRTALVQLDIRHYLTDRFHRIRIPQKEGVKTGGGRERPINWSQGYLDRWLNHHPNPDDPDAPLFCSIRAQDEGERLTSHAVYTMLQRTAERCDIDDERVHPHALRHARATAMRKSETLTKQDIENIMGWVDSTPMHSRYEHTTSTEEAERTAKRMGVDIGDVEDVIEECPRCGANLPPNARYCPSCTLKITGEPPEWWQLFETVASDTDPLLKQYEAIPSSVPELHGLNPEQLDHLYNVLGLGDALKDEGAENNFDEHPYDKVQPFETEKQADRAMEIMSDIEEELASIYIESPERIELLSESVDLSNIQILAEQHSDDE